MPESLVIDILVSLAAAAIVYAAAGWDGSRRMPRGVLKRISRPGRRHHVSVGFVRSLAGTWDPSRPMSFENWIHDYGTGVYWLEMPTSYIWNGHPEAATRSS